MNKFGAPFLLLICSLLFICHESGYSQDKQTNKKSGNKKYSTYSIENFKCFISDEVMQQNSDSTWTNKPVDILAGALRKVNEVYPENAKSLFHKTFIFVDWNKPGALGLYSQSPKGPSDPRMHFNCIDINGMKFVTEKNNDKKLQPNNAATLVLLHELAHCYHHQVLGWNHELVKDAYQNAKNQKCFELKSYLMQVIRNILQNLPLRIWISIYRYREREKKSKKKIYKGMV